MKKTSKYLILAAVAISTAACDGLLDVSDPTRVEEGDLTGPVGVELLRAEAVTQLYNAVSQAAYHTALVSDEIFYIPSRFGMQSGTLYTQTVLDQRMLRGADADRLGTTVYDAWNTARISASHAINWFERYGTDELKPVLGQLLAAKGYSTVALAEQVCSGFPLHDVDWDRPVYTGAKTTEDVFEDALAILDDAVSAAGDSAEYAHLANIARGRALLGLGRFDEAAQAVQDVPTSYAFSGEYGTGTTAKSNRMRFTYSSTGAVHGISDNEGGNGIDFLSANDPRLQVTRLGVAHEGTEVFAASKYQSTSAPILIASGIEARLIEAEAALRDGDANWLTILNDLRATQVSPAMDPLVDPGTDDARVDMLFRERAFWLFGTGHRLGDMRRLIAHYDRDADSVFPVGAYHIGGAYDSWTSLPFSLEGEDWAGKGVTGCID